MRIVTTTNLISSNNYGRFVILIYYSICALSYRYLRQINKICLIVMRF